MSYVVSPGVKALLDQYAKYKVRSAELAVVSKALARAKLGGTATGELEHKYESLTLQQQQLSDAMTFSNPSEWIQYKFEAYKNEAQPIQTLHDLRVHCSKVGYICTKRYTFLNEQLANAGLALLSDESVFPDEMSLEALLQSGVVSEIERNSSFKDLWNGYEFYTSDGAVAKWENFKSA